MINIFKYFLFTVLCFALHVSVAQTSDIKKFDQKKYEELVNSVDYSKAPKVDKNKGWNINWGLNIPPGLSKMLLYIFIPVIIILMFFLIRNQTKYRTEEGNTLVDVRNIENADLDITEINFDELLSKAILNGDYRLALRTLYLRTLQKLSKANYINWKLDKTNRQYLNELGHYEQLESSFRDLTNEYELYWYGERDLKVDHFENVNSRFDSFDKELVSAGT